MPSAASWRHRTTQTHVSEHPNYSGWRATTGSPGQMQLLFSCSVVSDSLQPHGLKHTRLPCPSLSPGVFSNSCPLSQLFASGGQLLQLQLQH